MRSMRLTNVIVHAHRRQTNVRPCGPMRPAGRILGLSVVEQVQGGRAARVVSVE